MLEKIVKGKRKRPRRFMLFGGHGVGKSTLASQAPNPLVLATEDGCDDIGVDRTPVIRDFGVFNSWLSDLLTQPHEYKTIVIDTLDWLEKLIHHAVAKKAGKASIEEIGYGKGYTFANDAWSFVLKTLDEIREQKNCGIILLAHSKIAKYSPPDNDPYDRYEPDLHKLTSPLVQEWCDEVFYAGYEVDTVKADEGFGKERVRAIGSGRRIMRTCETPTCLAKRRVLLPDVLPLKWKAYADCLENGNIDGVVKDGSSKRKDKSNG